jgi:glycerol-3-phosphate dehydrogenase
VSTTYDLVIIGGGINGCGIARDAAGRGLKVLLCEKDDIASHTSSYSSKLIHGGLRYLEQYEFRLVREALREREVLLSIAPHITRPLAFVLPHDKSMRPGWMLRIGLFLYDHLAGPIALPKSYGIKFPHPKFGQALKAGYKKGYVYSDLQVDDSRLTILNAISAREKGAQILTRTACVAARRFNKLWRVTLQDSDGTRSEVAAKGIVNAAGPWVKQVIDDVLHQPTKESVRLVKGSHIVVPRLPGANHAYILQNHDKRVIFVIPYAEKFSIIGTTDIPVTTLDQAEQISSEELDYLLAAVNRYFETQLTYTDVVWSYAGVRPLYDDGSDNPSKVTRDYTLTVTDEMGELPLLNIFGGKITTYRELSTVAMEKLKPYYKGLRGIWTAGEPLPGGDTPSVNALYNGLKARYSGLPQDILFALLRRYGTRVTRILGDAEVVADLGVRFGPQLTAREIDYLMEEEWARTAEDVLWRRTKCGLTMSVEERRAVADYLFARR